MNSTPGTATAGAERAAIESDFPGWHVWTSDIGRWYATRQGPDGRWMRGTGNPVTLDADNAGGLRDLLAGAATRATLDS